MSNRSYWLNIGFTFFACLIAVFVYVWSLDLEGKHDVAFDVEYLIEDSDSENLLTIDEIIKGKNRGWQQSKSSTLNFGQTVDPVWVRFSGQNLNPGINVLKIDFAQLDYVDVYMVNKDLKVTDHQLAGDYRPRKDRTIQSKKPIFLIDSQNDIESIYIKTQAYGATQTPITILTLDEYIADPKDISDIVMLFGGFALFGVLTYLLLFSVYRDFLYIMTIGWNASITVLVACYYATLDGVFQGIEPQIAHKVMPISLVVAYFFITQFVSRSFIAWEFAHKSVHFERLNKFLVFALGGMIFVDYQTALYICFIVHLIMSPSLLMIQFFAVRRNEGNAYSSSAALLLAVWVLFMITGILQIIDELGLAPNITFINHSLIVNCMVCYFGGGLVIANNLRVANEAKIQLEKELSQANQKLFQADKMNLISGFSTSLLHEIKNPLTWVKGAVKVTLAKHEHAPEAKEALNDCLTGIQRIEKIVKGLNWFASNDDLEVNQYSNLRNIVNEAITLSGRKSHKVSIENEVDETISVKASETHLVQVFINLLSNSLKAIESLEGDRQGSINVRGRVLGQNNERRGSAEIVWKDNGVGIDEETISQIFTPFKTHARLPEGSGLGMSVVHKIIQKHKGAIEVKSELGQWTEVTITLPNAKAEKDKSIENR